MSLLAFYFKTSEIAAEIHDKTRIKRFETIKEFLPEESLFFF